MTMSFLARRLPRLYSRFSQQIPKRYESTTANSTFNATALPPLFSQSAPFWVKLAWPIIIANALIMGSAVDITWNHWATLVKDLEAIKEANDTKASSSSSTSSSTSTTTPTITSEKKEEVIHWEIRPTWQRAAFCGIYGVGWALSTAYLLKYRQTYVTSLRFFSSPILSSSTSNVSTSAMSASTTASNPGKTRMARYVHISTASKPKGISLPLESLTIQEGRNETELVIRTLPREGQNSTERRAYWFMSLTDAVIRDGGNGNNEKTQAVRYGVDVVRERVLDAWDGVGPGEKKVGGVGVGVKSGWKSGPVLQ